ncbi:MAG: PLP-dependent aminotransferase family protein [Firmicutes bacterium]|nr:PLP-dependent aminotransferase family protein [Bacillota bacterium]
MAHRIQNSRVWEERLAQRNFVQEGVPASAFTSKPPEGVTVVSLSWGLPDPDLFPVERFAQASERVLRREGRQALQYGGSASVTHLAEWIAQRVARFGIQASSADVVVSNGSSQGMDLLARLLVDERDEVWVEAPSYFGALRIFASAGARLRAFPVDGEGLIVDAVREALQEAAAGKRPFPKLFYLMPNYHNPADCTLSRTRLEALAELAQTYGLLLLEDGAYGELCFSPEPLPALKALAPEQIFYMSAFSKTLAPGVRVGWLIGPSGVADRLRDQKVDGATSGLVQAIVAEVLRGMDFDAHVQQLRQRYQQRRDALVRGLKESLPPEATFVLPSGGFFVWLQLQEDTDVEANLPQALAAGVDFVPGSAFYLAPDRAAGAGRSSMRLCFSYSPIDKLEEGARRLGMLLSGFPRTTAL